MIKFAFFFVCDGKSNGWEDWETRGTIREHKINLIRLLRLRKGRHTCVELGSISGEGVHSHLLKEIRMFWDTAVQPNLEAIPPFSSDDRKELVRATGAQNIPEWERIILRGLPEPVQIGPG